MTTETTLLTDGAPKGDTTTTTPEQKDVTQGAADVTVEQQREFLVKGGAKADEIAKLSEADLKTQYGTAKGAADKATAAKEVPADGKYEFKMAEGLTLPAELGESLTAYAKEHKLTRAQAQSLADLAGKQAQAFAKQQTDHLGAAVQQWTKDAKADKELGGGAGFDANLAVAQRGMKEIFGEGGLKLLRETGLGNHPEIIRACLRAGVLFKNDTTEQGQHKSQAAGNTTFSYANSKHA